jgi:predicted transcriptional regulator
LKTEEPLSNDALNNPASHGSLLLTWLELDVMKAIWGEHPIAVRDVQQAIRPVRRLAYTTVMTIMHRLYLKGFLRRTLKLRTHYYEPAIGFADVRDAAVSDIIDHFFQGSLDQFLDFMGGHSPTELPPNGKDHSASLDETLL